MVTLAERQKIYEEAYDNKIIRRLPIIIRVDGKNFSRVTKRLPRPYSVQLIWLMANTMLNTAKEIDGCIFAFQQSDEISFVVRNDQTLDTEPWYNNRIQKIVSIAAAQTTLIFNDLLRSMDDPPDLLGQAIFDARVFALPSINEAVNNLIWRQRDCIRNAISSSAQAELGKRYGRKTALKMLHKTDATTKVELLLEKCDIDFYEHYPKGFRLGTAAYRVPHIVETSAGQVTRQRWALDNQLPEFGEQKDFLLTILNSGRDIFRLRHDFGI